MFIRVPFPYVGKIILINILIQDGLVDSDVDGYKEHLRAPLPIKGHKTQLATYNHENFNIIGLKGHALPRP